MFAQKWRFSLILVLAGGWLPVMSSGAAEPRARNAAELLPDSIVFFAEIADPPRLLKTVLDHPVRKQLEALPGYKSPLSDKQRRDLKAGVAIAEAQLQMDWDEALASLTQGGISFAFDAPTQGAAVVIRSASEKELTNILQKFLDLARADAANKGQSDPVKEAGYRGVTAYKVGEAKLATIGDWLVVTNKPELGKAILDIHLGDGKPTLAAKENFQKAKSRRDGDATLWTYLDLAMVRAAGDKNAENLVAGRAENPFAELLAGGIQSNLKHAPYVTASLHIDGRSLQLTFESPHQPDWIEEARQHYFRPAGSTPKPALAPGEATLLSLNVYRDIAAMWLRAGDLFNEQIVAKMEEADSNLSTLFAGRDFGQEILGAVGPDVQIVVARQDFSKQSTKPAIRLPAFAFVFHLKDPEKMQPELRRTFQSAIGFANIAGAQQGQPQLDMDMEKEAGRQIITATYLPEDDKKQSDEGRINFNFSPTAAFVGDRFILASSQQLARSLADAPDQEIRPEAAATNAEASLDAQVLKQILIDNRRHLVAQNMLKEGNGADEAEKQIDVLLAAVEMLRQAALKLTAAEDHLRLELSLQLQAGE